MGMEETFCWVSQWSNLKHGAAGGSLNIKGGEPA